MSGNEVVLVGAPSVEEHEDALRWSVGLAVDWLHQQLP